MENLKKNVFNLKLFTEMYNPQFIFLSEPMMFQSDLPAIAKYLKGEYTTVLNSEDLHKPELMLTSSKAKGGTCVMWKNDLDPFISVHISDSASFLPIVVDIPGWNPMIHLAMYLPKAGKDSEFCDDLARMRLSVEELLERFPSASVFIRGDSNSNENNLKRNAVFKNFCLNLGLARVELYHPTYHHFQGDGASDSEIDVLLFSSKEHVSEQLLQINCKLDDFRVDSHHDVLLSVCNVPPLLLPPVDKSKNIVAPKLVNNRHKIIWSEESIEDYKSTVSTHLPRIREQWLNPSSQKSMSILIECTNMVLSESAQRFNKTVSLSSPPTMRSAKVPPIITRSNNSLARVSKLLRIQKKDPRFSIQQVERTSIKFKRLKSKHQQLVRKHRMLENSKRDEKTFSVLNSASSDLFRVVRSYRKSSNIAVNKLIFNGKVYEGDLVGDGFYDSISHLKTKEHHHLMSHSNFKAANQEYSDILRICKGNTPIPPITLKQTEDILHSIKPAVIDNVSISGLHYRYSGESGIIHLNQIINGFIGNVNNTSLDELNTARACILHKGHGKNRSLAESYRTISCCPFLSRVLDAYLDKIYGHFWKKEQAQTQFQGQDSSHELAALLLTECIGVSLETKKKPVYVLYLDAKSAFDLVIRQLLINKLYHHGIQDEGLLLLDNRLKYRKTVCEWNGQLMGPISDQWGLEQGGKNSSEFYKVYNNDQLKVAQDSLLGVDLGGPTPLVVSAIGQADDVALVSNNVFSLHHLLQLSLQYCQRHHVTLRADKTKLQAFSSKKTDMATYYDKLVSPISIDNVPLDFVDNADHVGVLRSTAGNLPHIQGRITSHRKALNSLLPVGLAWGHRGNPAASLKINSIYAIPVLFSGLASLLMTSSEINIVSQYMKECAERLQKLMPRTPLSIVSFLGGQLPGHAQLHLRQLSIFGIISRNPESILYRHAWNILSTSHSSCASWFKQIRKLCIDYQLPHPMDILKFPPKKCTYNRLVKSHIVDHWEVKLRKQAEGLTSAPYFHPGFMSLTRPHSIWTSCGSNPYECHKAVVAARMLSGRYLTDRLQRHWTQNKLGVCLLPSCTPSNMEGSLEHILLYCTALAPTRIKLLQLCRNISWNDPALASILVPALNSGDQQTIMQLLLDCTTIPAIIDHTQKYGTGLQDKVLYFGRTWCYNIHRERMNQLGLFDFR